ncbi:MAG TPA: DNA-formamidopyrimidine glycosylase family protein [Candidatus Thermoplasmatota archaeon]|nr:DNA-formamidopyrimidine glycosylase family protein [Candidatus Thermoplasmatota archaeon]
MPELPDVEVYVEALRERVLGKRLSGVRVVSPFVLRTFEPRISEAEEKRVDGVRRMGKRIVFDLEEDLKLAIHLMIAGRLHWKKLGARPAGRAGLAAFDFEEAEGTLTFTEAATKHRAALHLVRGEAALRVLDAGGIEPLSAGAAEFSAALARENHTLKRALTDPRLFAGIGNAYSDEILHAARLSPMQLTRNLDAAEVVRLREATQRVLTTFTQRVFAELKGRFPEKVTAFRKDFAMHGKYGEPCPVCGTAVQRIVKGEHESNYCPRCQTDGKLLADRALSRLMHDDWPDTIDEWEERMRR